MSDAAVLSQFRPFDQTRGARAQGLAENASRERERRSEWRAVFVTLSEWLQSPERLCDEDQGPSRATLAHARSVAELLEREQDPPTSIIPSGPDVVFEWHRGDIFESVTVYADGSIDFDTFDNHKLVNTIRR